MLQRKESSQTCITLLNLKAKSAIFPKVFYYTIDMKNDYTIVDLIILKLTSIAPAVKAAIINGKKFAQLDAIGNFVFPLKHKRTSVYSIHALKYPKIHM